MNVGIECPFYMCENGSVRSLDIPFFDNRASDCHRYGALLLNSCLSSLSAQGESAIQVMPGGSKGQPIAEGSS